jgi:hypothetical protein
MSPWTRREPWHKAAPSEFCACGRPLHYVDMTAEARVRRLVELNGETVVVQVAGGHAFQVPRHYIALHGVKAWELADLARIYGWPVAP